jgi:hypothetical protein
MSRRNSRSETRALGRGRPVKIGVQNQSDSPGRIVSTPIHYDEAEQESNRDEEEDEIV